VVEVSISFSLVLGLAIFVELAQLIEFEEIWVFIL